MSKQFIGGIMFTASIALFGKGMHELGKLDERRKINKEIRRMIKDAERLIKETDKIIKKTEKTEL